MSCHRTPVNITLITYSYTLASFNTPDQARVYTSFTFNTERSVRHAVACWIQIGAGNYIDLDLLFCDGARFHEPHWSGLSKDGFAQLEANLREQKMEAVVQVVESLETLWEKAEYPPHQDNLWLVSAAYQVWNCLTEKIWRLHVLKHQRALSNSLCGEPSSLPQSFNPTEREPHQKEFEDFDGSSDNQYRDHFCLTRNLDGSAVLPSMATRPEEENFPAPDLSSREIVSSALSYWSKKNKESDYYDLEYLSYLWSEEFGGSLEASHNCAQALGIRKSIAGWEIILALKQIMFEKRFPPRDKSALMVKKSFKKWNQCSHDVQLKIDEKLAQLGPSAPSDGRISRTYTPMGRRSMSTSSGNFGNGGEL